MSSHGFRRSQTSVVTLDIRDTGIKKQAYADPDHCEVWADGSGATNDVVVWINRSDHDMELIFQKSPFKSRRYKVKQRDGKIPRFKTKVSHDHHRYTVTVEQAPPGITPLDPIEPSEADIDIKLDEGDTET